MKSMMTVLLASLVLAAASGCQKPDDKRIGPAEQAGREIDKAAVTAGEKLGQAGEKLDEAAQKAGEKLNQATEKIGEKVEEAGKDIQETAREARKGKD
ncbi:apolipophorin [Massilia sp. SR12]